VSAARMLLILVSPMVCHAALRLESSISPPHPLALGARFPPVLVFTTGLLGSLFLTNLLWPAGRFPVPRCRLSQRRIFTTFRPLATRSHTSHTDSFTWSLLFGAGCPLFARRSRARAACWLVGLLRLGANGWPACFCGCLRS